MTMRHYNILLQIKETLLSLQDNFNIPYSKQALSLVAGTGYVESKYLHTKQQVNNFRYDLHAVSYFQIEYNTFKDLIHNYLRFKNQVDIIHKYSKTSDNTINEGNLLQVFAELEDNFLLSVVVCRMLYYRQPESLAGDVLGIAKYWKKYYNTKHGKGTIKKFVEEYKDFKLKLKTEKLTCH